ncbi:hypothetical protein [Idiomarina fontislapidosi]|uniref:hypothetical protein n=1 Tax=Idiomarina fontislapidosi TaxID=263723 RepID=UPI000F879584|nr:hypothetical protein [Idiomarina fontislapidosi]
MTIQMLSQRADWIVRRMRTLRRCGRSRIVRDMQIGPCAGCARYVGAGYRPMGVGRALCATCRLDRAQDAHATSVPDIVPWA